QTSRGRRNTVRVCGKSTAGYETEQRDPGERKEDRARPEPLCRHGADDEGNHRANGDDGPRAPGPSRRALGLGGGHRLGREIQRGERETPKQTKGKQQPEARSCRVSEG